MAAKAQFVLCFLLGALAVASADRAAAFMAPPPLAACDQSALAPCLGALLGTGPSTAACCSQLMVQQRCLCQFVLMPVPFLQSLTSTVGKNLLKACGVPVLSC